MTMGSLFDGIGGFPLAAIRNGITPLWASEIEKFPMEVTKHHFPDMVHVGDITRLKGSELPPVDIITGGSPCQDLSVAGARAGLQGERSGLFMEQIRITKELREEDIKRGRTDDTIRPRIFVWENVPGAFSSSDGEDFRAVLEETAKIFECSIHVPRPDTGLWNTFIFKHSLKKQSFWDENSAWLGEYWTLNFGESPRDAKESTLSQILEETPHSKYYLSRTACLGILRRAEARGKELPPQLKQALLIQAGVADDTEKIYSEKNIILNDHGGERMDVEESITPTLRAGMGGHPPLVMASTQPNAEILEDVSPTVTAASGMGGGNTPFLCENLQIYENNAQDCRYSGPLKVAPTITASYGTGGTNTSLCMSPIAFSLDSKESNSMKSKNILSGCRVTEQSRTIDTTYPDPSKNQGGLAIVQPQESFCIAGNIINREDKNGGNGLGCQKDIAYTITATDRHSVFSSVPYQDVVGTLMHRDHKGVNTVYVNQDKCIVQPEDAQVFGQASYGGYGIEVSTLCATGGSNGGGSENLAVTKNLVRRLTPLECERLQGFPDNWTNLPGSADSPRYKSLGNSVAVPCVNFIMKGIVNELNFMEDICNTSTQII